MPHEGAVIELSHLVERRANLGVDRGRVCVRAEAQTRVSERESLHRAPMPRRELQRRRDRVLVGGDDAASPSDALDLRRSQLGDGAAVISLGSRLLTDTGGVEGNDRRPLLELRAYPPLQLAEARTFGNGVVLLRYRRPDAQG